MQSVTTPSIVPGATQNVLFSGFEAGEQVNLTLFSAPVTLSPVTADGTGVANVSFVVPADSEIGTHRLEAIGQQSGTTGVATFQVIAPPVTSEPDAEPHRRRRRRPRSPSRPAAVASPAVVPRHVVQCGDLEQCGRCRPVSDSGSSLWWLWLIIAIVVIAGIVTGIVVYRRNQQQQREQEEQDIADAAAQQQAAGTGAVDPYRPDPYGADAPTVFLPPVQPGPGGPPPGADPYGLLSGRDHPDNPTLYSGDGRADRGARPGSVRPAAGRGRSRARIRSAARIITARVTAGPGTGVQRSAAGGPERAGRSADRGDAARRSTPGRPHRTK